jgi:hypothetical protein
VAKEHGRSKERKLASRTRKVASGAKEAMGSALGVCIGADDVSSIIDCA